MASALLFCALAAPLHAATLTGALRLTERGQPVRADADARVWFEPATPATPPAPVTATIHTTNRTFEPRVLHVPAGSTVRFPNNDPILHNVFSVSPGNRFDVGLYRQGEGKSATFRSPGLVRVFCNVHRSMEAFVLVLATPHVAQPAADGSFTLANVPPGAGTLYAWHPRGELVSRRVDPATTGAVDLAIELTMPAVPPHLDKFGRPYKDDGDAREYR